MIKLLQEVVSQPATAPVVTTVPTEDEMEAMYERMAIDQEASNPMMWDKLQREEEEICAPLGLKY